MIDNYTEVDVQVGDRGVRVRGAESFVERKFGELAGLYLCQRSSTGMNRAGTKNNQASVANEYNFSDLYSIDADSRKLSIHGTVPGNSKSERMKNVALVTLFCLDSEEPISSVIIKEMCIEQACLDQSNFAAAIKKDKKDFAVSSRGAEWFAKLTIFGKQRAQELLGEMLNG